MLHKYVWLSRVYLRASPAGYGVLHLHATPTASTQSRVSRPRAVDTGSTICTTYLSIGDRLSDRARRRLRRAPGARRSRHGPTMMPKEPTRRRRHAQAGPTSGEVAALVGSAHELVWRSVGFLLEPLRERGALARAPCELENLVDHDDGEGEGEDEEPVVKGERDNLEDLRGFRGG